MTLDEAEQRCVAFMVNHGASKARATELWMQRPFTLEPLRADQPITDRLWADIQEHFRAIVQKRPSPMESHP